MGRCNNRHESESLDESRQSVQKLGFSRLSLPNVRVSPASSACGIADATVQTSDSLLQNIYYKAFYTLGENLGTESRNLEFKSAQGRHIYKHLKTNVSKYMTAFLNSEGGTLLFGVDDSGKVIGVECPHKTEDRLRLDIDNVMGKIRPVITTSMYAVNFQNVKTTNGCDINNLKVIEVIIRRPRGSRTRLYESHDGIVYLRRDASLQKLTPNFVQEWMKQRTEKWCLMEHGGHRSQQDIMQLALAAEKRHMEEEEEHRRLTEEQIVLTQQNVQALTHIAHKLTQDVEEQKSELDKMKKQKRTVCSVCVLL